MKSNRHPLRAALLFSCCLFLLQSFAQTLPGRIIRTAANSTANGILDPVAVLPTGWTSKTTAGFQGDDVNNAKLGFKGIPTFSMEPFGDLRRGPNHLYSDFVPDAAGRGVYLYYDGTNLLFRMRLGTVVPGAKGYSILVDTDLKFGGTGANADPNYLPATTGVNGNPGFEREIVLATGGSRDGISVYNIDGNDNASALTPTATYTGWTNFSQLSIAGTNDNGDPDFFLDFYVPLSALGVTASTPLRFNATTVMSGQPAIGGPKSDIYGLNDGNYKNTNAQFEAYINAQPPITPTSLGGTGTGPTSSAACTAAPVITAVATSGGANNKGVVTGTWTKLGTSTVTTATITVSVNGTPLSGTASATSGSTWTYNIPAATTLLANQTVTATAVATGETQCLISNPFTVVISACANWAAAGLVAPIGNSTINNFACFTSSTANSTNKGVGAVNRTNAAWTVYVNEAVTNVTENSTANQSAAKFSNNGGTTFNAAVTGNWLYSDGCQGGSNMTSGVYTFWYQDANGCKSDVTPVCVSGNGNGGTLAGNITVTPTISPATLTPGVTSVTVTAAAGTNVSLYYNGEVLGTQLVPGTYNGTATGTVTFNNLNLAANGVLSALSTRIVSGTLGSSYCPAKSTFTVAPCATTVPQITADANGQITAGQPITGTSAEPAGTTIRVYTSTNATTPVATVTVAANGSWTTSGVFNAVAGTLYNATAQNGSCSVSGASANATAANATANLCGTISTAVNENSTSVSGTLSAAPGTATTVNLYQDGIFVGTTSTSTTGWTVSGIAAGTFFPNSVVTIGLRQGTNQEFLCPASSGRNVVCSTPPTSPTFSPTSPTIRPGETVTYTLNGVVAGNFYGIVDANTGRTLSAGTWPASSGSTTLTTYPFSGSSGTVYNIQVKTSSVSATAVCLGVAASNVTLAGFALPVTLTEFKGHRSNGANELTWRAENETAFKQYELERSTDGIRFEPVATLTATGAGNYAYTDRATAATNHYRLKLVNTNGSFSYSSVVVLKQSGSLGVVVRPNPFVNNVTVELNTASRGGVSLVLTDEKGKRVAQKQAVVVSGRNVLTLDNLSHLAAGMYLLQVVTGGEVLQQKLVKLQ